MVSRIEVGYSGWTGHDLVVHQRAVGIAGLGCGFALVCSGNTDLSNPTDQHPRQTGQRWTLPLEYRQRNDKSEPECRMFLRLGRDLLAPVPLRESHRTGINP